MSFADWKDLESARKKKGFQKIKFTCNQAKLHNIDHVWVDTNCIDKSSSAELTEAINSMFQWYRDAVICYVYLEDLSVAAYRQELAIEPPWQWVSALGVRGKNNDIVRN